MKKVGITLFALALLTVSCKDKEVQTEVVEETQIVTPQIQPETADLKLAADNMDAYMDSEDKMMVTLGDADQLRLQKAIQIIGNMNVIYTEDEGIDHDKTDAAFLKEVGGKTFKEVCKVAEGYLKADQQREFDRINAILESIKDPKADADIERYNEVQHDLKEANKIPVTLDAYTYSEECFL
ncbi:MULTISPECIES: hypothetical protein [Myroides]|uniref:Lipoprotein n=1 Tax=Myroides odoratimimus CIP 101113 TaxID=883154 RepID=A0AAV3EYN2_9FLAO|nr:MULTISPECIES: hypothetical protein [Myroides]EHO04967.1 hypothetical protein HMPREF9715_03564 [Myroides odoratimimus CIP 101113]MCS7472871.1 hypothetical protein [Myroides odoratimimus]MDM1038946.1 hypothetical protein [Myroides odoratimimus]MDM1053133.1 hypothetical protein [Myroides odoratimimus]MDM1461438.1 hypothetical protein [Myroides odoratimimus]